jgi:hypothetical protein
MTAILRRACGVIAATMAVGILAAGCRTAVSACGLVTQGPVVTLAQAAAGRL